MCTREEVRLEVQLGEERMNARFDQFAMDNSKMVSNLFGDVQERLKVLHQKMDDSILDRNSIHGLLELNNQSHKTLQKTTEETLQQVKLTNGRVSSLEVWRGFMVGGLAVITAILLPIAFMVIHQYISR